MVHLSTSRIFQLAPSGWGSIDPRRKNRSSKQRRSERRKRHENWLTLHISPQFQTDGNWLLSQKKHVTQTHKHTHLPLYTFRENFVCEKTLFKDHFSAFKFFKVQFPPTQEIQSLDNKSPSSFASPDANYFFRANATTKPAFLNKKE